MFPIFLFMFLFFDVKISYSAFVKKYLLCDVMHDEAGVEGVTYTVSPSLMDYEFFDFNLEKCSLEEWC